MQVKKVTYVAVCAVVAVSLFVPLCAEEGTMQNLKNASNSAITSVENLAPYSVEIVATDFKFIPSEFTVSPGRKVKLTLVNKGKAKHNIQFDMPNKVKLKLDQNVAPGASGTLEFTAPAPGIFSFKCPVGFHSTLGMHGKMIVKEP